MPDETRAAAPVPTTPPAPAVSAEAQVATAPEQPSRHRLFLGLPRPSVTLALILSIGLLVLVSLLTVITIQWSTGKKNTVELLREITGLSLEYVELSIRGHLEPAMEEVNYIGQRIDSGEYDLKDRQRLGDLLTGSLASTPQIVAILTWDEDLQQFGVWRDRSGMSGLIERDQSQDPLIRQAEPSLRGAEGAFWAELVSRDGTTMLNLRRPLKRDGRYIGFMVAAITVQELSELISRLGDFFQSTAFVLYGRDHVLAHPNLTSPHPEQTPETPAVGLARVGDLALAEIWNGKTLPGFEDPEMDSTVVGYSLANQDYVAVYRELRDFGPIPWYIGVWFNADQIDTVLERLIKSGAASLLLLLLAIVAAVLIGRAIARPIRRVAEGTTRIQHLDLQHVDKLAPSGLRELDDQANAFNTMLASLRSFETYVPRSLVMRMIRAGEQQALTSTERDLTILFTDIAGFTALSENTPASEVAAFLNEHFALLGACVEAEEGTVDKFIGDALMAFWGAPDPQPDTAARACRAALAMAKAIAADNEKRAGLGKPPIHVRIGIHSGPVVVGNIGWPGRINYTIVGDTVNASQRLEGLGKELADEDAVIILVSSATVAQLDATGTRDAFKLKAVGHFEVKGKKAELEVFRLHA